MDIRAVSAEAGGAMTRQEVLRIVIRRARANGFEFRRWFLTAIQPSWTSFDGAVELLSQRRRYYTLLFSHEFARAFWKQGSQISFVVPSASYTRKDKNGHIVTVTRKPFTRRTLKADVWQYHLREMVAHDEPLRYIRRFLVVEGDVQQSKSVSS
jgi:hypothetical protein